MPIFAFRSWLSEFRIRSYLHHKNVSDKQRKGKEKDFNLHYMFFVFSQILHKVVYSIFMFFWIIVCEIDP